jgi:hypothetical protein
MEDMFDILFGISREQFMEDVKLQVIIQNPDLLVMKNCKICGGDRTIAGEPCRCCEGTGLPIEISDSGEQYLAWREPRKNEYYLLIHYKQTTATLACMQNIKIENGKITHSPLSQEQIDKIKDEINRGVVREVEMNICANSLEEAKLEAIEILQNSGDIVVKVEERDYAGWGIKSITQKKEEGF